VGKEAMAGGTESAREWQRRNEVQKSLPVACRPLATLSVVPSRVLPGADVGGRYRAGTLCPETVTGTGSARHDVCAPASNDCTRNAQGLVSGTPPRSSRKYPSAPATPADAACAVPASQTGPQELLDTHEAGAFSGGSGARGRGAGAAYGGCRAAECTMSKAMPFTNLGSTSILVHLWEDTVWPFVDHWCSVGPDRRRGPVS